MSESFNFYHLVGREVVEAEVERLRVVPGGEIDVGGAVVLMGHRDGKRPAILVRADGSGVLLDLGTGDLDQFWANFELDEED